MRLENTETESLDYSLEKFYFKGEERQRSVASDCIEWRFSFNFKELYITDLSLL